jgi:hypothetical protein
MSITIDDMNTQVAKIAEMRVKEEELSRAKKEVTEALELEERKMMEMLEASGMTSYKSPFGQVVLAFRTSVKTPKLPEEREAFFQWLRDKGLYDTMISVNSNSLNSLYKNELEEARDRGEVDFSIPGISGVSITPQLRFSRG